MRSVVRNGKGAVFRHGVGDAVDNTDATDHNKLLIITNVENTLGEGLLPGVELDGLNVGENLIH